MLRIVLTLRVPPLRRPPALLDLPTDRLTAFPPLLPTVPLAPRVLPDLARAGADERPGLEFLIDRLTGARLLGGADTVRFDPEEVRPTRLTFDRCCGPRCPKHKDTGPMTSTASTIVKILMRLAVADMTHLFRRTQNAGSKPSSKSFTELTISREQRYGNTKVGSQCSHDLA